MQQCNNSNNNIIKQKQEAKDVENCPQEEEDKEDCPICCDALPKLSDQFARLTCCGKGLHNKCAKDLMTNFKFQRTSN